MTQSTAPSFSARLNVLVACEFSGVVRDAFAAKGFNAYSCDWAPTEKPGNHYQCDVLKILGSPSDYGHFDLLIAHPPCTYLAVSGNRWMAERPERYENRLEAIRFFFDFVRSKIQYVAIENPVGVMSTIYRKPDQIIQPWQFGHPEVKATCLWLRNLPTLKPTNVVDGRESRVHRMSPGPERQKERSRTYQGVADAMAEQWGNHIWWQEQLKA